MGQGPLAKLAADYPGIADMVKDHVGIPPNEIIAAIDDLNDVTKGMDPNTANVIAAMLKAMNGNQEVVSGPLLYVALTQSGWDRRSKSLLNALLKGSSSSSKESTSSSVAAVKGLLSAATASSSKA